MADETTTDTLSVAQHKAVFALLSEPTIRKAAASAEVPERTLYYWLKQPDFAAEYRTARQAAMQAAIATLQQHAGRAAATLVALMSSTRPDVIRLRAALGVLDAALRGTEIEELRNELEQLAALVREMSNVTQDL